MTQRFENAYNALVKAYFEGTLAKGSCHACAVGNIVCSAQGGTVETFDYCNHKMFRQVGNKSIDWSNVFMTSVNSNQQHTRFGEHPEVERQLFELTGYTAEELAQIEYAFETNTTISYEYMHGFSEQEILEDQFKGLCAVINVMMKLDNMTLDEKYTNKFREHPTLSLHP